MMEQTVRAVASRGPFLASDVERACAVSGVRLFGEADVSETLRQMQAAGEVEPSGRWVDPRTRLPLFRTAPPARPKLSQEDAQYGAFAALLGIDAEPVQVVETTDGAPVVTRPQGVSAAEQAEFEAWAAMFGGAV